MKINYYVTVWKNWKDRLQFWEGKNPNPIIPVQKIRNISLEITGDPIQDNPHELDSENESTKKSDLEAPLELDPFEIWPVVTQKTKQKMQDRPAGLPPDQWPLARAHYM